MEANPSVSRPATPSAVSLGQNKRRSAVLWNLHAWRFAFIGILLILLPAACVVSLGSGPVAISSGEVTRVLLSKIGLAEMPEGYAEVIVMQVRLPRVLAGILVGAALASAGAAMQGLFRNPLADPGLIGVSSGAALGAVLCIIIFPSFGLLSASILESPWTLFASAFLFALGTTVLIYALSSYRGRVEVATMLLAGVALNALAGAITGFALFKADDAQLRDVTFWTLGSLARVSDGELRLAVLPILACVIALPFFSKVLNAMLIGESAASQLGFNVTLAKRLLIGLAALSVGLAVAMAGTIGFIGLVVPHLVRLCIGPDHRFLLIASPLLGATLLVFSDLMARTVAAPAELPIGIITALAGAPFFLWLLLRQRSRLLAATNT